jgi:hypothetical protein
MALAVQEAQPWLRPIMRDAAFANGLVFCLGLGLGLGLTQGVVLHHMFSWSFGRAGRVVLLLATAPIVSYLLIPPLLGLIERGFGLAPTSDHDLTSAFVMVTGMVVLPGLIQGVILWWWREATLWWMVTSTVGLVAAVLLLTFLAPSLMVHGLVLIAVLCAAYGGVTGGVLARYGPALLVEQRLGS